MRRLAVLILFFLGVAGIGGTGYWLGHHNADLSIQAAAMTAPASAAAVDTKILYYRDPTGKPSYSATPKKDSSGADYLPVYEGKENKPIATAGVPSQTDRKILYYRNPMGLPDTSPVPKKDAMGMDYVPVYTDDADDGNSVKINPAKVQQLGVATAAVERRSLSRTVRAVGTIQVDERRLYVFNTKFDGWIDKLYVNATGETVKRGEPLMDVYAPNVVVAEQEYLLAWRALQRMSGADTENRASAKQLVDASLLRLQNWDISQDQIKRLQDTGVVSRTLTLRAPADGVVLDKIAVQGMHFASGELLYRIADLSSVWLIADVFERDIGALRVGQDVEITLNAYPGTTFSGKVAFVYPTVSRGTRTGKVRIVVPNPDLRLKTGMYANVALDVGVADHPVLAVPDSAVIDSGTKQTVLVARGNGMFEPRPVKLGAHADGYYEIRTGLAAGERIVVSASFLIDAESNLQAALKTFAPHPASPAEPQTAPVSGAKP